VPRDDFWCGNEVLDNWLKQFAGQNEDRFRSRTFFAIDRDKDLLVGYYTAVFTALEAGIQLEGLPVTNYKIPAYLIAKLAVDHRAQNAGIGKLLLGDALNKAARASGAGGLEVVVVDAINNEATSFYGKFGFTRVDALSNRMFLYVRFLQDS
jgi:GNAT superfamily N-acetyltransferase